MKKRLFISLVYFISFTCLANDAIHTATSKKALQAGDIVFWKDTEKPNRAGHVAVINDSYEGTQIPHILHSTDHPKYNAFVETHMLPSEKLLKSNKYYWVIRVKDQKIRQSFIENLYIFQQKKIPFNVISEELMNKWDDSMSLYSTEFKFKLQNQLFAEMPPDNTIIPNQGYMCSEVIIIALQNAWKDNRSKLPISLQIIPMICPPSTFMFAIQNDHNNFKIIGKLHIQAYDAIIVKSEKNK